MLGIVFYAIAFLFVSSGFENAFAYAPMCVFSFPSHCASKEAARTPVQTDQLVENQDWDALSS